MPPQDVKASDHEKIMLAFINQLCSEDGAFPTPNYVKMAQDLGLPTPSSAQSRWFRFTSKVKKGEFGDLKINSRGGGGGRATPKKRTQDAVEPKLSDDEGSASIGKPAKRHKFTKARKNTGQAMERERVNDVAVSGSKPNNDINAKSS
ncbi:hypothetical protein DID88_008153 [Monilinia fructigena]|uniref:Uncharacterized protein n=1 Tax=Monilinia fructigena TaxID=38457 RepID=A0A395J5I0_9HELO|nr:hypothetical protein DID88_008153 [Monilinia fructigena]